MSEESVRALQESQTGPVNAPPSRAAIEALMRAQREREGDPMARIQGQKELGPPGLEDVGARFSLALADTFSEKRKAFLQHYPTGDLQADPVDGTLLFRPDAATPYAKVDPGLTEKYEPLGDIIDLMTDDIGAIAGETAALLGTRGATVMRKAIRAALGGWGGDVAQQYGEGALIPQEESFGEISSRAAVKGMFGAGGTVLGVGVSKVVEGVRGGGFAHSITGTPQAERAAEYLGAPPLIVTQVANSPVVRRWGAQAATLTSTISNYVEAQSQAVRRAVSGLRENQHLPAMAGTLARLHKKAQNDAVRVANVQMTSAEDAGEGFLKGIIEYDARAKEIVDVAYERARKIDTPEFSFDPIDSAIQDLRRGQPAPGLVEKDVTPPPLNLRSDKRGMFLHPKRQTVIEPGAVQTAEKLKSELNAVINTLEQLDRKAADIVIDGETYTMTDGLLRLRERLWELKTPNPGELVRREHAQAGSLYNAITRVIDNPGNVNANFRTAWRTARDNAAARFETWEMLTDVGVAKHVSRTTLLQDDLIRKLVQPHKASSLGFLRGVVNNTRFGNVQNFFKSELIKSPSDITATLAKYDKETLDILLTPTEQKMFANIGRQMDRINLIGLDKILAQQSSYREIIERALYRKDTAAINELHKLISLQPGGLKSQAGKALRAGLLDVVYDRITAIPEGELTRKVIFSRIQNELKNLRGTGAMRFLTEHDLRTLKSAQVVEGLLRNGADAGTSIHAMEATSGARRLEASALQTIAEQVGVGWLITQPWYTKFVVSRGKPHNSHVVLQSFMAGLATLGAD